MLSSAWLKRIRPLEDTEKEMTTIFCHEKEQELYETLTKLPAKYRIVLYLRYYEKYQVKEIAAILHILPNTVSARLTRAKKIMKQEILKEMEDRYDEKALGTVAKVTKEKTHYYFLAVADISKRGKSENVTMQNMTQALAFSFSLISII